MKGVFVIEDNGNGFRIMFPNGITLITRLGVDNYCEYCDDIGICSSARKTLSSCSCEVRIEDKYGNNITKKIVKKALRTKIDTDYIEYVEMKDWLKIFEVAKNFEKEVQIELIEGGENNEEK